MPVRRTLRILLPSSSEDSILSHQHDYSSPLSNVTYLSGLFPSRSARQLQRARLSVFDLGEGVIDQ